MFITITIYKTYIHVTRSILLYSDNAIVEYITYNTIYIDYKLLQQSCPKVSLVKTFKYTRLINIQINITLLYKLPVLQKLFFDFISRNIKQKLFFKKLRRDVED